MLWSIDKISQGEQVITLQIVRQLKTKNIDVIPEQLFCRQCKAKFLLEADTIVVIIKIKLNL